MERTAGGAENHARRERSNDAAKRDRDHARREPSIDRQNLRRVLVTDVSDVTNRSWGESSRGIALLYRRRSASGGDANASHRSRHLERDDVPTRTQSKNHPSRSKASECFDRARHASRVALRLWRIARRAHKLVAEFARRGNGQLHGARTLRRRSRG